jgi:hypothetical protein
MGNCAYFVAHILGTIMANNLFNAIRIAHRSPTAILNLLVESYGKDYTTFATGNNRGPLEEAVKILTGSKLDKALALAISKGYEAGDLTIGYIGATSGKYAIQPSETHAKYDGAIERATSAFRVALIDSGLFAEKEEKSKAQKEEEKAKREEEKAKKEAETRAAILHAAVVAGEVVRSEDVKPYPATEEMVTIIYNKTVAGLLTTRDEDLLFNGLVSRMDLGLLQLVQKRIANEISAKVAPVADTVADTVTA